MKKPFLEKISSKPIFFEEYCAFAQQSQGADSPSSPLFPKEKSSIP